MNGDEREFRSTCDYLYASIPFGLYVLYSFRYNFPYEDMLLQKIYSTFFCFVLLRMWSRKIASSRWRGMAATVNDTAVPFFYRAFYRRQKKKKRRRRFLVDVLWGSFDGWQKTTPLPRKKTRTKKNNKKRARREGRENEEGREERRKWKRNETRYGGSGPCTDIVTDTRAWLLILCCVRSLLCAWEKEEESGIERQTQRRRNEAAVAGFCWCRRQRRPATRAEMDSGSKEREVRDAARGGGSQSASQPAGQEGGSRETKAEKWRRRGRKGREGEKRVRGEPSSIGETRGRGENERPGRRNHRSFPFCLTRLLSLSPLWFLLPVWSS